MEMGNFHASKRSRSLNAETPRQENFEALPKKTTKHRQGLGHVPLQSGDLSSLGFEYRLVACEKHAFDTDTTDADCFVCKTRLFHIESGFMITGDNQSQYIPDGPVWDAVTAVSQEMAQERVMRAYSLKFITICDDASLGEPVRAMVDNNYDESGDTTSQQPTLLIITGKGKSRVGVLSVKQLLISGMEVGSAMCYLAEARKRGLAVILLDPNARGHQNGMGTVERSLTRLFSSWKDGTSIHVLAHSAAGGYLVRYLLLGDARQALLRNAHAIALTDSTHNLQWAREDKSLLHFLQSPKCLYVRNTSTRPSDTFQHHKNRKLGEVAETDLWWRRRFGEIRTVWAGTTEHSLILWTARGIIWDFFDGSRSTNSLARVNKKCSLDM